MFYPNATSITKWITTKERTFNVSTNTYHLSFEENYFDLTMNAYHLYYHFYFHEPINREVVALGDEAYFSVTPENVKGLQKQEYVSLLTMQKQGIQWMYIFIALAAGAVLMFFILKLAAG